MAKKKTPAPSFCEWMVGTTVESALGPLPKPPSQRKLFRVEISTDDESGEDSVHITYPRTSASSSSSSNASSSGGAKLSPQKSPKKVRFQESAAPRKSAMKQRKKHKQRKKQKALMIESETDESDDFTSDSATDGSATEEATSGDSSGDSFEESSEVEVVKKRRTKKRKNRKKRQEAEDEEESSETDGSPHPSCKCWDCARGRRKLRRRGATCMKTASGESTSDGYDSTDTSGIRSDTSLQASGKKAKRGKKTKIIIVESDSGDTSTDAFLETDTESDSEPELKKKHRTKNRKDKSKKNQEIQSMTAADGDERVETKKERKKQKKRNESSSKSKGKRAEKKKTYPEANPLPHPRRPNYIAPVRAEVVQAERVLETPEDPAPNAYYDAEHNIMRVYHGPVYGGNPNQSLYSKRDPSKRPLPIGTPHPSHNPYFHGFNAALSDQPQTGLDQMPNPYGLPNPYCPPGMPVGAQTAGAPEMATNKGAFHGLSVPEGIHYFAPGISGNKTGERRVSPFAAWGKRGPKLGSQRDPHEHEHDRPKRTSFYHGDRSAKDAQSQNGTTSGQQTQWGGDGGGGYQAGPDNTSQNNDNNQDNTGGGGDGVNGAWDNGDGGNNSTWGNDGQAGDGGAGHGHGSTSDNVMPSRAMPGEYPDTTLWGDQNAATNTGGKADEPTTDDAAGAPAGNW